MMADRLMDVTVEAGEMKEDTGMVRAQVLPRDKSQLTKTPHVGSSATAASSQLFFLLKCPRDNSEWCLYGPGRYAPLHPRLNLTDPPKGEDNSPASFEKTLSNLSTKITQTTTRQDAQRQLARRFKALWTLYTSFAYLLYSIVVALVVGWENYGLKEIPALVGGPVMYGGLPGCRWMLTLLTEYTPSAQPQPNFSTTASRECSDSSMTWKRSATRRSRS